MTSRPTGWDAAGDQALCRAGVRRDLVEYAQNTTLPDAVELPRVPVFDQAESSCVARALVGAAWIRARVQGSVETVFSWRWPWWYGRRDPEVDSGMSFEAAIAALDERGWCADSWYPDDGGPPLEAARHAYDQRGLVALRPLAGPYDLRVAIASGYPVIAGFLSRYGGPHAVVIVGYDSQAWACTVRNSWGDGWGNGGYETMNLDVIADDSETLALWAVEWAPTASEVAT